MSARGVSLFLILFLGFFCPLARAAQEAVVLDKDEALALALRNNPEVRLQAEEVKKAKEKILEHKTDFLPNVTAAVSRAQTRGYFSKDVAATNAQISLIQYLYRGGYTTNNIAFARETLASEEALLDATKLEIAFRAYRAFYTVLLAQEFAALNKGILENTKAHQALIAERYKAGEASQYDMLTMEEARARVEETYQSSLNAVASSAALLKNILCVDEGMRLSCAGGFVYTPHDEAYDRILLESFASRPEIRQYEAQIRASKKLVEVNKAATRPQVYASWDYYSKSHNTLSGSKGWNDYNAIGVTVSWPIFDGFSARTKVAQALIDVQEAQLAGEKIRKDIALEVKNAYLDLQNAVAALATHQTRLRQYQDALKTTEAHYARGIASSLALDDARLAYRIETFNVTQAIYDCIIATATLEKAQGGL
jgi:outer membrane protein TolC